MSNLVNLLQILHKTLRNEGFTSVDAANAAVLSIVGHSQDVTYTDPYENLVVPILAEIHNRDVTNVFDIIYQEFCVAEARAGFGQYLTPQPVAEFIAITLSDYAKQSPVVLDPFCGAGVLLNHFGRIRPDAICYGIELNTAIASIATKLSQVTQFDFTIRREDAFRMWESGTIPEADVVVANPPFGAAVTGVEISTIPAVAPSLRRLHKIPAELLGLDLCVNSLKPGGAFAVVLPSSVLSNSSWAAYRSDLIKQITIHAVVSLPEETFTAYRGVARACVLFGTRQPPEDASRPTRIAMYQSLSVGYDATGRASLDSPSDLSAVAHRIATQDTADSYLSLDMDGHQTFIATPPMADQTYIRLGDIADVFTGRTFSPGEYSSSGPFVLKVGDLDQNFISWVGRGRSHIPPEVFDRLLKIHLRSGDICFTAAAHRSKYIAAKINVIYEMYTEGAIPSAEVMVIRLKPDAGIEPESLMFYLKRSVGYQQLQQLIRGSTAHVYPKDVRELLISENALQNRAEPIRLYQEASTLYRDSLLKQRQAYSWQT